MSIGYKIGVTRAKYETRVTRFVKGAGQPEQVLPADPRRWYVYFEAGPPGAVGGFVFPEPAPTTTDAVGGSNLPRELKFWDAPSIIAGAWLAYGNVGGVIFVTECLYVGD